MSTEYVTPSPMTLAEFFRDAAEAGWVRTEEHDDRVAVRADDGNMAWDVREEPVASGDVHVLFTRYAGNYVQDLVELFDAISEHDDEFWPLIGYPTDEEENQ